jgi:hypothetical protein
MSWVAAILAVIPAIAKILDNPVVGKVLEAIIGLFIKTDAEKAVDKFKDGIKDRKEARKNMKVAIRDAKKSYTKSVEDIINRRN